MQTTRLQLEQEIANYLNAGALCPYKQQILFQDAIGLINRMCQLQVSEHYKCMFSPELKPYKFAKVRTLSLSELNGFYESIRARFVEGKNAIAQNLENGFTPFIDSSDISYKFEEGIKDGNIDLLSKPCVLKELWPVKTARLNALYFTP